MLKHGYTQLAVRPCPLRSAPLCFLTAPDISKAALLLTSPAKAVDKSTVVFWHLSPLISRSVSEW